MMFLQTKKQTVLGLLVRNDIDVYDLRDYATLGLEIN